MRKTLATLLAATVLYFVPFSPLSINSHSMVTASKFQTVANPIPNRYIVVLATTDLSPIADPAPTPLATTPKSAKTSTAASSPESSEAFALDSSSTPFVAEPMPDPQVETTATALTTTYGGTYSRTWSAALKGVRLHATEAEAIAMSGDSRVAFVVEDGAIAVGTPDADPIVRSTSLAR